MLIIAKSMRDLHLDGLSQVYDYDRDKTMEFEAYLRQVFFQTKGAVYCIWQKDGRYVSALRLEPFEDGWILAGLETAPQERRKGYATELIRHTVQWLGNGKVYAHIYHRNKASIAVHQRCGFRQIAPHARFLDGSVSAAAGTYFLGES